MAPTTQHVYKHIHTLPLCVVVGLLRWSGPAKSKVNGGSYSRKGGNGGGASALHGKASNLRQVTQR